MLFLFLLFGQIANGILFVDKDNRASFNDDYKRNYCVKTLMETTVNGNLTLTGTINECVILNDGFADIQKKDGVNGKGIPVIKEDLSMDIGNGMYFNGDDHKRKYGLEIIEGEDAYIHNRNMLNIGCANDREMGLLFDFNTLPHSKTSTDTARISFYKSLTTDAEGELIKIADNSTLEIAIADNDNYTTAEDTKTTADRIVVRKYSEKATHMIDPVTGNIVTTTPRPFSKEYWDQYATISSEIALIDYDGKTKIGANNLVVGEVDVYKLLLDLVKKTGLNIDAYKTTGFIPDYRDIEPTFDTNSMIKTSYRDIEKEYDEKIGK